MRVECDVIIMIIFLSAYKSGHILQAPKQLPTLHMNVHAKHVIVPPKIRTCEVWLMETVLDMNFLLYSYLRVQFM